MNTRNEKGNIKDDLKALEDWLGSFLASLWTDVEPAIVSGLQAFFNTFGNTALSIVTQLATQDNLTGQQKFDSAKSQLATAATAAGWTAAESAIETLVQNAYTIFKAREGVQVVTQPPSS